MEFIFIFSTQSRQDGSKVSTGIQKHGLIKKIRIDDLPDVGANDGNCSHELLSFVENYFVNWAREHLDDDVIEWECRQGNMTGEVLSRYRVFVPSSIP